MRLDTGFRPSRHGFGFPNRWHDLLLGVVSSRGRCGGMVFAALDAFLQDESLPADAAAPALPAHDSAVARSIWGRQVASVATHLGGNLWRFARLTYLPTHAVGGIAEATRRNVKPLLDSLAAGVPVPLGLVSALTLRHLARNHQVLAYAAEAGGDSVRVHVYDPNYPGRDDVVLEIPSGGSPAVERVGGVRIAWRGMFVERYSPAPPLRAEGTGPVAPVDRSRVGHAALIAAGAIIGALAGLALHARRGRAGRRG